MNDTPDSAESRLPARLANALHETETSGGWWGHPECEEFARIITPTVEQIVSEARADGARLALQYAIGVVTGAFSMSPDKERALGLLRERRDSVITPGATCNHCGSHLPHTGTSWREAGACRKQEASVTPPGEVGRS